MTDTARHWPKCPKCSHSFPGHVVRGLIAYCVDVGGARAPWSKDEIFGWRLDVGMKVTDAMRSAADKAAEAYGRRVAMGLDEPAELSR